MYECSGLAYAGAMFTLLNDHKCHFNVITFRIYFIKITGTAYIA